VTTILENSDILQACATTLAGVLIFLTIERKLNVAEIENTIHRLRRDMEIEDRTMSDLIERLKREGKTEREVKDDIDKHRARLDNLDEALKQEYEKGELSWRQVSVKNAEDIFTLLTLSFLTSCILFMIAVDEKWIYDVLNYSMVSVILFSAGLISLVIRVILRTID